jgi:hypothetical protein
MRRKLIFLRDCTTQECILGATPFAGIPTLPDKSAIRGEKRTEQMSASSLSRADRIAIEHECEKLVRLYALYVDAGDYDLLGALFAKEAAFARPTDPENPIAGRDAIVAGFRKRPTDRITRHIISACVIEVDDSASAHGQSYMALYQGPRGGEGEATVIDKPVMIGGFEDRFVFEDGAWRFLVRAGNLALKSA